MYKANNIDVDKFLEALKVKQENASYNHSMNFKIEEARYNQERETLAQIEDMFYCCNYEKHEDNDDMVMITRDQYNEYQQLMLNLDSKLNIVMEEELENWAKETLYKLVNCLKDETYLIYGENKEKKICNISYAELDKVIAYTFSYTLDELQALFTDDQVKG